MGEGQVVRPPLSTIKDFLDDLPFEGARVLPCKLSFNASRSVFFDDPGLITDADDAAAVPALAASSESLDENELSDFNRL